MVIPIYKVLPYFVIHVLHKKLQDDNWALRVSIEPHYGHLVSKDRQPSHAQV